MARRGHTILLGEVARAGFHELTSARDRVAQLAQQLNCDAHDLLSEFSHAADPDSALLSLETLWQRHQQLCEDLTPPSRQRMMLLFGASPALGTFFARNPARLNEILQRGGRYISEPEAIHELTQAVAGNAGADAVTALRVRYRELLAEVLLADLQSAVTDGSADLGFEAVAESLSHLATGAIEAALDVARASIAAGLSGPPVEALELNSTQLAVIAMGKWGAQELNVVSDVDVMFIAEPAPEQSLVDRERAQQLGTRIAIETMRTLSVPALEPALWEVDAGLRPEGRQGALVRSLSAMVAYYEKWAKTWEFQALIKARAAAGDRKLGEAFVAQTREWVWSSAQREDFVASVQRMRERVTEHIHEERVEAEIKLGPGGLRDIEFSVQLLQLVHGQHEPTLHLAGTLSALEALVAGGFIGRSDGERLAHDYRLLRTFEHRLQMRDLRRTALMPTDEEARRILARAASLGTADVLTERWEDTKREVRALHLKIFYAPLLAAVASLPDAEVTLTGDETRARLASLGFRDPDGAIRHLAALSSGTSRNARIQRNLLPVLLQWIAAGTDPDFGLLAFRRVSEANRDTPWYLRLLRDGSVAAERLTRVLASSHIAADLLEDIPEAVAWLERDELLMPTPFDALSEEMRSLTSRRDRAAEVAPYLRAAHRREILRLALGRLTFVLTDEQVSAGLDAAYSALLDSMLFALQNDEAFVDAPLNLTLIAMGRYGGGELGFASDIDLIAVYRPAGFSASAPSEMGEGSVAAATDGADSPEHIAAQLVSQLQGLLNVPGAPVELDFDLRPEGRNGPIVRSLGSYRSYYERWSLTWEAQALLRARPIAGDRELGRDFEALANEVRYREEFTAADAREVRLLKARVEAERLPRGADPRRHLKLGPGGVSDVEWLVQLLQLRYAARESALRVSGTLDALSNAAQIGALSAADAAVLSEAWRFASAVRSAAGLWTGRNTDVLPMAREDLEGIARIMGFERGQTTELEERWFLLSRRARAVFEREFFEFLPESDSYPSG